MYIFGFLFPVTLCVCCYMSLLRAVRKNERSLSLTLSDDSGRTHYKFTRNRRRLDVEAAKSCVFLLLFYLMSWTPYATVCLLSLIGYNDFLTPVMAEIPCLFAKMAAIYDPFIYAFTSAKFRAALGIGRSSNMTVLQNNKSTRKRLSKQPDVKTLVEPPDLERTLYVKSK
ncbi:unnamed protein product [Heterobilharzia americana]|nr:unnamed protein product [Heterobilharzia americana]